MTLSAVLRLCALPSAGRVFGESIPTLGPQAAASFNRWANAWRLYLRGSATAETLATLKYEADFLQKEVQRLPDAEQYEAAMALFSRTPRTIALDAALVKRLLRLSVQLEPARELLVVIKFTVASVPRRLQHLRSDPWQPMRRKAQTLTATMKRQLGVET